MTNKIKLFILSLMLALTGVLALSPAALADTKTDICNGVAVASGGTGCDAPDGSPTVQDVVATVVNVLSWIVGIVAVIMIIIAGFKYITSGGDSGNVTSAKNTILFAIVGLVIVALAQVIIKFVLNKVSP